MPTYQPDLRLPNNFNVWGGPTSRGFTYQPMAQGSSSSGRSESGEYYTPQQQRRLDELYPQLQQLFLRNSQPQASGNAFLQLLSQAGGAPLAAQPSSFGGPADFGQPADFGPRPDFGQVTPYPTITSGPVWSPQQVDERVNQGRAQAQQQLAGEQRNVSETMASKGYAGGSPVERELLQNMYALNLAGQTGAENDLRWGAAQGNARHLLDSQQADVERSRAMGDEDVRRRQMGAQYGLEQSALKAQDELRRKQLAATDDLQRRTASADDRYRWAQASDQSDLERRRIATQLQGLQSQERSGNQNALLQAMMQTNRPLQRSRSQQNSESGMTGGGRLASRNSNIWNNGLWS